MIEFKLSELLNKASLLILFLLYSNLASTCYASISCDYFIPTLSYLSTFRSHDVLTMLALSLSCFFLALTFISFHLSLEFTLSTDDKIFMLIHELGIMVLTLMIGIIDESSGIDFNPVDDVHRFLTFALCFLGVSWNYWALKFLGQNKLRDSQQMDLMICSAILKFEVVAIIITMIEWHFAYTIYHGVLFNNLVESIFEWISITIAVRVPYHICKVMDTSVRLINKTKPKN